MYKKVIVFVLCFLISVNYVSAQHQEVSEKPETWKGKKVKELSDSTSLLSAFKNGHFSGHFRSFSMATDNSHQLTDYYAFALGGGLKFETANFHHFQFGVSGFYIFNMGSSDFSKLDSTTGQANRYELALFEIPNPTNKNNIDRLEELYLRYNFRKSFIVLGKQLINTPFINLQDGRMRPTEVMGIWAEVKELKNIKLEGGILNRISPRSTLEYYTIGKSIGIYPSGVNTDGTKSGYANNLESDFIGIFGATYQHAKQMKFQLWNQYVDRMFNTSMVQADYQLALKNSSFCKVGIQSIFQSAVNEGGNSNKAKTYFDKGAKSFTYGARLAYGKSNFEASLNYNRITTLGRYLMPREWGREPFFTFMPRERNEGLSDVHAFLLRGNYNVVPWRLKTSLALGYYKLPDVLNVKFNKYGMPSYGQINLDVRYEFNRFFKGLETQLLIAHKVNAGNQQKPKALFNKVDMTNYNLIVNYHF